MNPLVQNLKKSFGPLVQPFADGFNGVKPPTIMASTFGTPKPVTPSASTQNMSVAPVYPTTSGQPIKPVAPTPTGDPAVRAQQIALNANGAGLKVDGILGPLTMAAIKNSESKVIKTPAGGVINPNTGGVSEAPTTPPVNDSSLGAPTTTPPIPTVDPYRENVTNAENAYATAGMMTPEEEVAQTELDNLLSSTRLGIAGKEGQGRGIPLDVVRGEQAKLEKQGLLLAEPLQAKLARLQAKRTSALEASKFALERADKALETETGKTSTEPFTLSEGQVRYDAKGKVIAKGGEKVSALEKDQDPNRVLSVEEAKNLGVSFGTTAGEAYGTKVGDVKNDKANEYSMEKADRAIALVDEALSKVSGWNTGFGSLLSVIPASDSKDFGALIESIKANIGFNELSAMRAASPTGGALGQVAVQELNFLQAVLGSLDTSQKPETVKANLEKIKTHFNNWKATMQQAGGGNAGGTVIQTTVGPINTNW